MRLRLSARLGAARPVAAVDPLARPVTPGDAASLAELMLTAYRGTVDDAGEGPEETAKEIAKVFAGGYGPFDVGASEVVVRDGVIVAATLVTEYEGLPLIAFSMTAPEWQRRGLARAGLLRTMARLRAAGRERADLAVTETNVPARRLYESLGFERVEM
jgi:RimJ/RimL family protein N-acetyltransferase